MKPRDECRRSFLGRGIALLGSGLVLGSAGFLGGCGDDKGQMAQVENAPDPKEVAKASMEFGTSKHAKAKGGAPR
jgi:hypothetical protein